MKDKSRRIHSFIYIIFDCLAIILAGLLSMLLRFGMIWDEIQIPYYLLALITVLVTNIIVMYFNKLYDLRYKSWVSQLPKVINSFLYNIVFLGFTAFFIRQISFSRLTFIYFTILSLLLLSIFRYIANVKVKKLFLKGIGVNRLLIIGITDRTLHIIDYLKSHPEFGYHIVGAINKKKINIKKGVEYLGNIDIFHKIIRDYRADSVIMDIDDNEYLKEIVRYCEENYIQAFMVPDLLDIASNPVDFGQISNIPLIKFKEGFISGYKWKAKRFFDLMISTIALILLSPLFLVTAILIKLTSKGNVFFRHERMGMNGEVIKVYKFRTMVKDAEKILYDMFRKNPELEEEFRKEYKLKNDPRITKVGAFLRKTSIDELPQLINVLRGEMSIVGPRPIVRDELDKYGKYAKLILKVPPGITGMWQMSGRNDVNYDERIKLDMYYINNWSFGLDVMIILKTIPAVLARRGAY